MRALEKLQERDSKRTGRKLSLEEEVETSEQNNHCYSSTLAKTQKDKGRLYSVALKATCPKVISAERGMSDK